MNIFSMAQDLNKYAKVILFFDEGETLFAAREGGNKYTTAVTSELLSFMSEMPEVMVMVSTNLPWTLEEAFRRRFAEKILVDLPPTKDLAVLLKFLLRMFFIIMTDDEYREVAGKMSGYTAGDVALFCDLLKGSMNQDINGAEFFRPCPYRKDETLVPCGEEDINAIKIHLSQQHNHIIDHQGYTKKDLLKLLKTVQRSTSTEQVEHHRAYAKDNTYNPEKSGKTREEDRWRQMENSNKQQIREGLSKIQKQLYTKC
jgi:SpoVK/Ycf46/Vps4 family AAA+-type ATPase